MISKRSHKRVYEPPIKVVLDSKIQSHDVTIVEISRSGLRFVSNYQFHKGEKLRLSINEVKSNLSLNIKAKIINAYGKNSDNKYEYGVRFYRVFYWYEKKCIDEQLVYSLQNREATINDNITLELTKKTEKNQ